MAVDRLPDAAGCGVGDPSPLAQAGAMPAQAQRRRPGRLVFWPAALRPAPAAWRKLAGDAGLPAADLRRPGGRAALRRAGLPRADFDRRLADHLAEWRGRFAGIELDVPDPDFQHAFFAGLQHLLTAMVGDQARIAPLAYPLPWLRDSIYIIRCLDLAGFHDLARAATGLVARNDFFGGYGAEGDAPGQGLWALVQHYRLTHDLDWLKEVYPSIQRKVEWLLRMRQATRPLQVCADTPVLAFTHAQRASGVICLPAKDRLIQGDDGRRGQLFARLGQPMGDVRAARSGLCRARAQPSA